MLAADVEEGSGLVYDSKADYPTGGETREQTDRPEVHLFFFSSEFRKPGNRPVCPHVPEKRETWDTHWLCEPAPTCSGSQVSANKRREPGAPGRRERQNELITLSLARSGWLLPGMI